MAPNKDDEGIYHNINSQYHSKIIKLYFKNGKSFQSVKITTF